MGQLHFRPYGEFFQRTHAPGTQPFLECITIQKIRISQKQDEFFPVEEAIKTIHSVAMS